VFIYRVTRIRRSPRFHQHKTETGLKSERSMLAIVKEVKRITDNADAYGYPPPESIKIERAEIGEFTDVTEEFFVQ
jgi:hypothetical protein